LKGSCLLGRETPKKCGKAPNDEPYLIAKTRL
jgi:hypothetical protein